MITNIQIDNFKSLKNINVDFGPINFVVGPNASGKSNFAEALDFISHAVREDLAYAVAEKGGFYNICHRRQRRARGAITFKIKARVDRRKDFCVFTLIFQLRTKGEDIRADFYVASEQLQLELFHSRDSTHSVKLEINRLDKSYEMNYSKPEIGALSASQKTFEKKVKDLENLLDFTSELEEQQLLFSGYLKGVWPLSMVTQELQALRVFQLNPRIARLPAAPSVHGDLGRRGENLASALDRMRLKHPTVFATLSNWLKDVVPTLGTLITGYTETRQLGLFFQEDGFASRWYAEDVSDGTIMSVALFFALLDKRHKNIVIEEPETSLHPWILRKFLQRCREQSQHFQIIITTHSPLAVAHALPNELFLIERTDGISTMRKALDVEGSLDLIVKKDLMDLGQYWLSGGLGAVPALPEIKEADLFGTPKIEGA